LATDPAKILSVSRKVTAEELAAGRFSFVLSGSGDDPSFSAETPKLRHLMNLREAKG
jgi:hypothetical protein